MQFLFNDEQQMLRDSMTAIVTPWRAGAQTPAAARPALWSALADSGMTGVCVSAEFGGSGLGLVEAGLILEALGGVLDDGAFLMSAVLAVHLLARGKGGAVAELLTSLASGGIKAAVLLSHDLDGAFVLTGGRLQLTTGPTIGLDTADLVLLVVRGTGSELPTLVAFPAGTPELAGEPVQVPDVSRPVHALHGRSLTLDGASLRLPLPRDSALLLRPLAAAAQSAQALGGGAFVLEAACQYARERVQFGGPIGRFQALKHMLADDRVMLDGLRSLSYAALWQLGAGASEGPATAYAAKACAAEVYGRLAADAVQVLGAMGIAAESQPHRYLKRSLVDRVVMGAPSLYLQALHDLNAGL